MLILILRVHPIITRKRRRTHPSTFPPPTTTTTTTPVSTTSTSTVRPTVPSHPAPEPAFCRLSAAITPPRLPPQPTILPPSSGCRSLAYSRRILPPSAAEGVLPLRSRRQQPPFRFLSTKPPLSAEVAAVVGRSTDRPTSSPTTTRLAAASCRPPPTTPFPPSTHPPLPTTTTLTLQATTSSPPPRRNPRRKVVDAATAVTTFPPPLAGRHCRRQRSLPAAEVER